MQNFPHINCTQIDSFHAHISHAYLCSTFQEIFGHIGDKGYPRTLYDIGFLCDPYPHGLTDLAELQRLHHRNCIPTALIHEHILHAYFSDASQQTLGHSAGKGNSEIVYDF